MTRILPGIGCLLLLFAGGGARALAQRQPPDFKLLRYEERYGYLGGDSLP
jgi:hypothetical protein